MRKLWAVLFLAALTVVIFLPKDFMRADAPLTLASSGLAPIAPKT